MYKNFLNSIKLNNCSPLVKVTYFKLINKKLYYRIDSLKNLYVNLRSEYIMLFWCLVTTNLFKYQEPFIEFLQNTTERFPVQIDNASPNSNIPRSLRQQFGRSTDCTNYHRNNFHLCCVLQSSTLLLDPYGSQFFFSITLISTLISYALQSQRSSFSFLHIISLLQ